MVQPRVVAADDGWVPVDVQRDVNAFGGTQGPRNRIRPTATPKDLLDLFLDFALWTLLVSMTNQNADRKRQAGHNSGAWHPVDIMEMQAFIGLVIVTRIVRMPSLKMYWQTRMPLCNLPSFNKVMPRNRFLQIS